MCQSPQESQWNHFWALGLAKSGSRIGVYGDSVVRSPQLLHLLSFAYQSCLAGEWGRSRENVEVCITTGLVLVSGLDFFKWKHKLCCSLAPLNISKLLHFKGICKLARSTSQCVYIFLNFFFLWLVQRRVREIQYDQNPANKCPRCLICSCIQFSTHFN